MKALVIGELCVDKFIYGRITRLCPEAPVPVLNPVEEKSNNGMAGNVVENLRSLVEEVEIIHWHQSNKIEKVRYVEQKSNQMIVRVDSGELVPCEPLSFLSPDQKRTISESDIVIISDYNKGYLSSQIIDEIAFIGKLTILDSKKKLDLNTIKNLKFVKLNEIEYLNNKEIVDSNPEKFIVTLGSNGAMYMGTSFPSLDPQETIDVSGAGDTFTSSFIVKYFLTGDAESSINFANQVCADVVSRKGVTTPDKKFRETKS